MFKWLKNLPTLSMNEEQFQQPHTFEIGPSFHVLLDKVEYLEEQQQTSRMRKMSQWINEHYSKNSNHIILVNFTPYTLEPLKNTTNIDFGVMTNFHYEQVVNIMELCGLLHELVSTNNNNNNSNNNNNNSNNNTKSRQSSSSSSQQQQQQLQVATAASMSASPSSQDLETEDNVSTMTDDCSVDTKKTTMTPRQRTIPKLNVPSMMKRSFSTDDVIHVESDGESSDSEGDTHRSGSGSGGNGNDDNDEPGCDDVDHDDQSTTNPTVTTPNNNEQTIVKNNRLLTAEANDEDDKQSVSSISGRSTSTTPAVNDSSMAQVSDTQSTSSMTVDTSATVRAISDDTCDDESDTAGILSGSGIKDKNMSMPSIINQGSSTLAVSNASSVTGSNNSSRSVTPTHTPRTPRHDGYQPQQAHAKNTKRVIFYCTADNVLYGFLACTCLVHFSTGDPFIEGLLNQYIRQVNQVFASMQHSPKTPRISQQLFMPSYDNIQASLTRYCKFFTLLTQLPMPPIYIYSLESVRFNSLLGVMNSPRPSPRNHRLSLQAPTASSDGKLYIVVKQNEQEVYGAFFQQQQGIKGLNSSFMLDNSQSKVIMDSNGETWYVYDIQKTGQPVNLLGDFVICCYWVVRDTFKKLFRFTFNTMFIRNETHQVGQKKLDLTQPKSKLDWADNELIPFDFIVQLNFSERTGIGSVQEQSVMQSYRDKMEEFLKQCPYYYLNNDQMTLEHRLSHVFRHNDKHMSEMTFVITELKAKFNLMGGSRFLRHVAKPDAATDSSTSSTKSKGRTMKLKIPEGLQSSSSSESNNESTSDGAPPPPPILSSNAPPPPPPMMGGLMPPPPPPMMGGMPPPPPGMPGMMTKPAPKENMMKRVDWKPIKNNQDSNDSVWKELMGDIIDVKSTVDDNVDQLKTLFTQKATTSKLPAAKKEQSDTVSVLPSNISRNISIVIASQFKGVDDAQRLIRKIMDFDEIPSAHVASLYQLISSIPEESKTELLKAGCSTFDKLPKDEQFMFHFLKRDHIQQNLLSLMYMNSSLELFNELNEKLEFKKMSCDVVRKSEGFKKILAYILAVGNIMNEGRRNLTNVSGFNLDILPKLDGTRANDPNTKSLLHYIAKIIKEKEESVCTFYQEDQFYELVSKSAKLSLSSLIPLQKEFTNQAEHLQNEMKYFMKNKKLTSDGSKRLTEAADTASGQLEYLTKLSQECESTYLETLEFYHYDTMDSSGDSDPFFSVICDFVNKFKKACDENTQKEEQERAKLRRQNSVFQQKLNRSLAAKENALKDERETNTASSEKQTEEKKGNQTELQSQEETKVEPVVKKQTELSSEPAPVEHTQNNQQ